MSNLPIKKKTDGELAFESEVEESLIVTETSYNALMAGDVVSFNYQGSQRFGFVVKSRRTDYSGMFLSTRNNVLLNVFLLDSISTSNCRLIINTLYRNRIRATYKNSPKILSVFLGKQNFRTFNTSFISDVRTYLIINIDKLRDKFREQQEVSEQENQQTEMDTEE